MGKDVGSLLFRKCPKHGTWSPEGVRLDHLHHVTVRGKCVSVIRCKSSESENTTLANHTSYVYICFPDTTFFYLICKTTFVIHFPFRHARSTQNSVVHMRALPRTHTSAIDEDTHKRVPVLQVHFPCAARVMQTYVSTDPSIMHGYVSTLSSLVRRNKLNEDDSPEPHQPLNSKEHKSSFHYLRIEV